MSLFLIISVAAGCAIIFDHATISTLLVYDRQAILAGELWRLLTGHLVHFSGSHLLFNLLGFFPSAWIARRLGCRHIPLLCAVGALAISGALLLWQPGIAFFGGLSGIVNAVVIYAAIHGLRGEGNWRWFCLAAILFCLVGAAWELLAGTPMLARPDRYSFVPVPVAHLVGALSGGILAVCEPLLDVLFARCHLSLKISADLLFSGRMSFFPGGR